MQEAVWHDFQFQSQHPGGAAAPRAARRRRGAAVFQPPCSGNLPQRWVRCGSRPPPPEAGWLGAAANGAVGKADRWPVSVCTSGQCEVSGCVLSPFLSGTLQQDGQTGLWPHPHPISQVTTALCPGTQVLQDPLGPLCEPLPPSPVPVQSLCLMPRRAGCVHTCTHVCICTPHAEGGIPGTPALPTAPSVPSDRSPGCFRARPPPTAQASPACSRGFWVPPLRRRVGH